MDEVEAVRRENLSLSESQEVEKISRKAKKWEESCYSSESCNWKVQAIEMNFPPILDLHPCFISLILLFC